jgi:hypothetical protein
MQKLVPWSMLLALLSFAFSAVAQDNDALPPNYLAGTHVMHANNSANLQKKGNIPTPQGFPQGVDTIVNFTHQFQAPGVFYDGSAHQMWEYSMVGNPPQQGGTTVINAPVVPVSLDLRNSDGSPRYVKVVNGKVMTCSGTLKGCQRLYSDVTPFVKPFMNGPVFANANYSSSPVPTQITDAVQRAEFGNHAAADWHTLLNGSVKAPEVMTLLRGTYHFALNADGSCCLFVLIDDGAFATQLFPQNPAGPDNSSVVGQAELAGNITTKSMSTFLFPNAYLYSNGDPSQCCTLGYHTFDFEPGNAPGLPNNGNQTRFYVLNYSSWITPGLFNGGFEDVTAHSHEIAETFNDPFVAFDGIHNVTPFWLNPAGQCQDVMEVGDVIEDLPNPTYPVTVNGYTYHPQTEALLPWFEFQTNSTAIDNAYSYPNENVLTSLSAAQPLNCGGQ